MYVCIYIYIYTYIPLIVGLYVRPCLALLARCSPCALFGMGMGVNVSAPFCNSTAAAFDEKQFTILYCTVLHYTILYAVLYCTSLYYTILYTVYYILHYVLYTIYHIPYTICHIPYTIYYILYLLYDTTLCEAEEVL